MTDTILLCPAGYNWKHGCHDGRENNMPRLLPSLQTTVRRVAAAVWGQILRLQQATEEQCCEYFSPLAGLAGVRMLSLAPKWVRFAPNWENIRDFFRSDFSTFWLAEPKCTLIGFEKSRICPISGQLESLLAEI